MENKLTYAELYEDLVSAHTTVLPEKYFTLKQFCGDTGLPVWTARRLLEKRVVNGELDTMQATLNGRKQMIWWFSG